MRPLLPLITAAVLTHGYHFRRQRVIRSAATRLAAALVKTDDEPGDLRPVTASSAAGLRRAPGARPACPRPAAPIFISY